MSSFGNLFAGIAPATEAALNKLRRRREFSAGEDLLQAGERPAAMYRIVAGRVKVWRPGRGGSGLTLRYCHAGDTPGLIPLIRQAPAPATATAVTPVVADAWQSAVIADLLQRDAALANNALGVVSNFAVLMAERLDEALNASTEQLMSRALLRLAGETAQWTGADQVEISVSRQELADLTGTTAYTASRLLSDWARRGLVESGRGRVVIKQPETLAELADVDG